MTQDTSPLFSAIEDLVLLAYQCPNTSIDLILKHIGKSIPRKLSEDLEKATNTKNRDRWCLDILTQLLTPGSKGGAPDLHTFYKSYKKNGYSPDDCEAIFANQIHRCINKIKAQSDTTPKRELQKRLKEALSDLKKQGGLESDSDDTFWYLTSTHPHSLPVFHEGLPKEFGSEQPKGKSKYTQAPLPTHTQLLNFIRDFFNHKSEPFRCDFKSLLSISYEFFNISDTLSLDAPVDNGDSGGTTRGELLSAENLTSGFTSANTSPSLSTESNHPIVPEIINQFTLLDKGCTFPSGKHSKLFVHCVLWDQPLKQYAQHHGIANSTANEWKLAIYSKLKDLTNKQFERDDLETGLDILRSRFSHLNPEK